MITIEFPTTFKVVLRPIDSEYEVAENHEYIVVAKEKEMASKLALSAHKGKPMEVIGCSKLVKNNVIVSL